MMKKYYVSFRAPKSPLWSHGVALADSDLTVYKYFEEILGLQLGVCCETDIEITAKTTVFYIEGV